MSVRIGIYDFFAYTLPGVLYILVTLFALFVFNVVPLDPALLSEVSLTMFLVVLGTGYFVGSLVDPIAYEWASLFIGRNRVARQNAFDRFCKQFSHLEFNFKLDDWPLLLQGIKKKSGDAFVDIEMHNVASIMLRNVSLALLLVVVVFLGYFVFVTPNFWNIVFALLSGIFSWIAIDRCNIRRHWFYEGIFTAFTAIYMFDEAIDNLFYVRLKESTPELQAIKMSGPGSLEDSNSSKMDKLSLKTKVDKDKILRPDNTQQE